MNRKMYFLLLNHLILLLIQCNEKWSSSAVLNEHNAGILAIGVMQGQHIPSDTDWFSSSSSDGVLKIWRRRNSADGESEFVKLDEAYCSIDNPDQVECFQTIQLGSKYAMALAMGCLPNSNSMPALCKRSLDMY